jgi:hypothetical protein
MDLEGNLHRLMEASPWNFLGTDKEIQEKP